MADDPDINEQKILHAASAAFTRAQTRADVEVAWQRYVSPYWEALDSDTQGILSRLHALRLQTASRA